jgi:hypothetical protein
VADLPLLGLALLREPHLTFALALKLARCGYRNGKSFLAVPHAPPVPCFGLCDPHVLQCVLNEEGSESLDSFMKRSYSMTKSSDLSKIPNDFQVEKSESPQILLNTNEPTATPQRRLVC